MTENLSLWVLLLQSSQQLQQSLLLCFCPCVGRLPLFVQATLVADTERMLVIALGMGTDELFMARLVSRTVGSDVVVIARKTEAGFLLFIAVPMTFVSIIPISIVAAIATFAAIQEGYSQIF